MAAPEELVIAEDWIRELSERLAARRPESLAKEKAKLAKNWGADFEINRKTARKGAEMVKATADEVAIMERSMGYAAVMEMFRKIGAEQAA